MWYKGITGSGLHRAKRGVEPLLHRLNPTRGGEHLVGRATDLKAFRRLDGGILQFVERLMIETGRRVARRYADVVGRRTGGYVWRAKWIRYPAK
jgi:hypothetical protein